MVRYVGAERAGRAPWIAINAANLGGPIAAGNVSYAVDGRQYIAVIAGDAASQQALAAGTVEAESMTAPYGNNSIHVFALPASEAGDGAGRGE